MFKTLVCLAGVYLGKYIKFELNAHIILSGKFPLLHSDISGAGTSSRTKKDRQVSHKTSSVRTEHKKK